MNMVAQGRLQTESGTVSWKRAARIIVWLSFLEIFGNVAWELKCRLVSLYVCEMKGALRLDKTGKSFVCNQITHQDSNFFSLW